MKKKVAIKNLLGGILISLGILIGFIICSVIVWGDLEASVFTSGDNGDSSIKNLSCPVLITPKETGTISVVLKNPADKESDRYLRAFISEGYATLVRETKTKVPLPANGKQKVEWQVFPEDAAFKRVILFRVYVNAKYPYPSMSGNCGIVKIDIPLLSGNQLLTIASLFSLSSLALGVVIWEFGVNSKTNKGRFSRNAVYFLAGILVLSAIFSYFGFWLIGILGLAVAIILVGVIIFRG
jgi:hypothetical protein